MSTREYRRWQRRKLDDDEWRYIWADNIERATGHESPLLIRVIIGANAHGRKSLLAFSSGEGEDTEVWHSLLLDLHERGMKAPLLAIADGGTGFKEAVAQIFRRTLFQSCWTRIQDNLRHHLPAPLLPLVDGLRDTLLCCTTPDHARVAIENLRDTQLKLFPEALASLGDNHRELIAFYNYPTSHWKALWTTDLIHASLANVRLHSSQRPKRANPTALAMLWEQAHKTESSWSRLPSEDSPDQHPQSEGRLRTRDPSKLMTDNVKHMREEGVSALYHFTSIENLPLIRTFGGLCSKKILEATGHWPHKIKAGGDPFSWDLDKTCGNWNYVALSPTPHTPMAYRKKTKLRLCFFVIDLDVVNTAGTLFTNTNATSKNHIRSSSPRIADWKQACSDPRPGSKGWKDRVQAEILIPGGVKFEHVRKIVFKDDTDRAEGLCQLEVTPDCECVVNCDIFVDEPPTSPRALLRKYATSIEASGLTDLVAREKSRIFRSRKVCTKIRKQFSDSSGKLAPLIDRAKTIYETREEKIWDPYTHGKEIRRELSRLRGAINWARSARNQGTADVDSFFNGLPKLVGEWCDGEWKVTLKES